MVLSQRTLQINGNFIFNFRIRFRINGQKLKNIQTHIDESAMCYISID